MLTRHVTRAGLVLGTAGMLLGLAGCAAKVKQEDYNTDMAKLREEMQAGNQQLAARIDSTNASVGDHSRRLDALEQELQALVRLLRVVHHARQRLAARGAVVEAQGQPEQLLAELLLEVDQHAAQHVLRQHLLPHVRERQQQHDQQRGGQHARERFVHLRA